MKMGRLITVSNCLFIVLGIVYTGCSKLLFDKIYLTSNLIIDEEFHLPLGESYCNFDFFHWDPKVTTLPGLYLLSAVVTGPFGLCTIYWLRFVSFLASVVNLGLFYVLFSLYNEEVSWKNLVSSMNLALLPPLYFFSHLYYTDVPSIMMCLILLLCERKQHHYLASLFGLLAILMRQTNVIWVGMIFGDFLLRDTNMILHDKKNNRLRQTKVSTSDFMEMVRNISKTPGILAKKMDLQYVLNCLSYLSVLLSFCLFVLFNGGIVVGDKTAHIATLHIPQFFYFALFTLIFAWPHFLSTIPRFCKLANKNRALFLVVSIIFALIIHFNTQVHPYILADNRHYIFYIWSRFYSKYVLFKYLIIPAYLFALYGIVDNIWNRSNISFGIMYLICVFFVLVTQKLIELRYFLFPFVLFRLQLKKTNSLTLGLEFLTYLLLNVVTIYLFFNKAIFWDNYHYPQRLIW